MAADLTYCEIMTVNEKPQATGGLNIDQIMGMLMHRPPFLLVDRVIDCLPGRSIQGYKNVSRADGFVGACGSDVPTMPRLLLIEALAQISVILTYKTLRIEPTGQELMFFAGIDDARFVGNAVPGDVLNLYSEVVRLRTKMGWFRARADVKGALIAEMTMIAAIQLA